MTLKVSGEGMLFLILLPKVRTNSLICFPNFILSLRPPYINPSIKVTFPSQQPKLAMQVVLRYQLGIHRPSRNV